MGTQSTFTLRVLSLASVACFTVVACGALAAAGASKSKSPTASATSQQAASKEAVRVAQGIQRFYDQHGGFQADFLQVVKKRGLKKGIKRRGKVWLRKGDGKGATGAKKGQAGHMRWDYPKEEIFYFSDGRVLWTYERRESLAIKLPVKNSRLYQATSYLVGQGDLATDFHMTVVKSPVPGTHALKLKPRQGTGVMRSLTLVVDQKTFAVKASILVDPLGDSTSLFFSKASYSAIPDKVFQWTPPKGVRVKTL